MDADTVKTFLLNQEVAQPHPVENDNATANDSATDGNGQASPTPEAPSAEASLEASAPGA